MHSSVHLVLPVPGRDRSVVHTLTPVTGLESGAKFLYVRQRRSRGEGGPVDGKGSPVGWKGRTLRVPGTGMTESEEDGQFLTGRRFVM